jgi:hypothetical protein
MLMTRKSTTVAFTCGSDCKATLPVEELLDPVLLMLTPELLPTPELLSRVELELLLTPELLLLLLLLWKMFDPVDEDDCAADTTGVASHALRAALALVPDGHV